MTHPFSFHPKSSILLLCGCLLSHDQSVHAFVPASLPRNYPFYLTSTVSDGQIDFFFPLPNDEDEHYMDPLDLYLSQRANKFARFLSFLDDETDTKETTNSQDAQREEASYEEEAIQCFIVNYDQVENEGATPEVYCTPNVEEFAWFNGLDKNNLVNTQDFPSLILFECVDSASPRGVPEWECKVQEDDGINEDDRDGWGI